MQFSPRNVHTLGIVGFGTMGQGITALLAQVFVLRRRSLPVSILVYENDPARRAAGPAQLRETLMKPVESAAKKGKKGPWTAEQAEQMLASVSFVEELAGLAPSQMVIEAIPEILDLKQRIFAELAVSCPNAILVSNSSHQIPNAIFASLEPDECRRTAVVHFFWPADRNAGCEIVRTKGTSDEVVETLDTFLRWLGKVPIPVKQSFGYALNPIFEALCLACVKLVQMGIDSKLVDAVAAKVLGAQVGPLTVLNLTKGNVITAKALDDYGRELGLPWFEENELFTSMIGREWTVPARGEKVSGSEEDEELIREHVLSAYFTISSWLVEHKVATLENIELGVEVALQLEGPFSMMRRLGEIEVLAILGSSPQERMAIPLSRYFPPKARQTTYEVRDGVAIITVRRPQKRNALSRQVYEELLTHMETIEGDNSLEGAVITGYDFGGTVTIAGADIGDLEKLARNRNDILAMERSRFAKSVGLAIENCSKPVVFANLGGLYGGGFELALACHDMVSARGLRIAAILPEVGLGIIPGAGGTVRLPRRMHAARGELGFLEGCERIRRRQPFSSEELEAWGLSSLAERDEVLSDAILLVCRMADGLAKPRALTRDVVHVTALPPVEINDTSDPRSRSVDHLLVGELLASASFPYPEALEVETLGWGQVVKLDDCLIGLTNFRENGPGAPAKFVHS